MKVEFEPELVPIQPEPYAKLLNCFLNVKEKVKRDGGWIHYGWAIHKTTILCAAERHAVWEDEQEELVDITPTETSAKHTLFVSDNEEFEYTGQDTNNVRVNITNNPVVDDFIRVSETLSKIHTYGIQENDMYMRLPDAALELHQYYDALKNPYKDLFIQVVHLGSLAFAKGLTATKTVTVKVSVHALKPTCES